MRTVALVTAILAGAIPSVVAAPAADSIISALLGKLGVDLTVGNHYGAPVPPWKSGSKPGWYYGPNPDKGKEHGVPCLSGDTCKVLEQYASAIHCPSKPSAPKYPSAPPPKYPPPPPPPKYTTKPALPPKHTTSKYEPPKHTTKDEKPPKYTTSTPKPHETKPPQPTYVPPQPTYVPPQPTYVPPQPTYVPPQPTYVPPQTTYVPPQPTYVPPQPTYTPPQPTYVPPPPPPSGGYKPTFYDISAAVQADDYMTFGLVETVEDCQDMCDSVDGCGFVNTYHDVHGKDGSPLLTCALFKLCHGAEDADNRGGQSQPDGSINFIADSNGWCKD